MAFKGQFNTPPQMRKMGQKSYKNAIGRKLGIKTVEEGGKDGSMLKAPKSPWPGLTKKSPTSSSVYGRILAKKGIRQNPHRMHFGGK